MWIYFWVLNNIFMKISLGIILPKNEKIKADNEFLFKQKKGQSGLSNYASCPDSSVWD